MVGIFKKDFLTKVEALTNELKTIRYIDRIISPTNIKNKSLSGLAPVQKRLLHIEDESLYKEDSINIYNTPELIGSFFPKDAKSLSIFIERTENKDNSKTTDNEKARFCRAKHCIYYSNWFGDCFNSFT